LIHAFSVDVEDWYQGIPVARPLKATAERRLAFGLNRLLDVMGEQGAKGTFFILGPLVQSHPHEMRRIADEGHEIGCHGWSHDLLYEMTPARFLEETRNARDRITNLVGKPVTAYRAAYFSVTRRSLWALEILASLGFLYDSSIFPVKNWRYGIEDFSRDPILIDTPSGRIWEFPISVMERYGHTISVSGGAYFRIYPYAFTRSNLRICEQAGRPVIFYVHPWELDPDHPRVDFYWKPRLTHYINLRSTEPKLRRLLRDFRFGTIHDVIGSSFLGRRDIVETFTVPTS
jgi:polysaccharide deacetylase family protein (PEP-CTERM system associated)